jgi:L-phenylalanine/L-methionine N-acetyltransferase
MPPAQDNTSDYADFDRAEIIIRGTRIEDAAAITEVMNLPGVRYGTLRQPYQSIEKTRKFIEGASPNDIQILAEWRGKVIGNGGLHRKMGRQLHSASLGIGVHDDFTGKGVGSALLHALIDAADNWHDIRRIELSVFTDNVAGIRLYENFGFRHEGTLRQYAFRNGEYVDAHIMARIRG